MLTIAAMALTVLAACFMGFALEGEARYALSSGPPLELADLSHFKPQPSYANRWAHGEATLSAEEAVSYSRPLESGGYRLAKVLGNDKLWVQVRVPDGLDGPHFLPPNSFVGRLVPARDAGLRYRGLRESTSMPKDAWLLIDGEAPETSRWVLGLLALFAAFALFNAYGLVRLLRPIKDG